MMFRIAEKIAEKENCLALLTGESIGQVASQTVENLTTINEATGMLVLRPLAGSDKKEVIVIARNIDTFDISKLQVPDSCTVFAPKSPATKTSVERIRREEDNLGDFNQVIAQMVNDCEIVQ